MSGEVWLHAALHIHALAFFCCRRAYHLLGRQVKAVGAQHLHGPVHLIRVLGADLVFGLNILQGRKNSLNWYIDRLYARESLLANLAKREGGEK